MAAKLSTYWRVATVDGEPTWTALDGAPASTRELVGELKVENDDQIMRVFFADEQARQRVTTAARDAAALAQEWQIPHRPAQRS